MKIKVIKPFHDTTLLKKGQSLAAAKRKKTILRKKGIVMTVSIERGKQIIQSGYGLLLEMPKRVLE